MITNLILILLIYTTTIATAQQFNDTDIISTWYLDDNYSSTIFLDSTLINDASEGEVLAFEAYWLYAMIGSGFIGIILILAMTSHTIYHFRKDKIIPIRQRILYIFFFCATLLSCFAYAFLRSDLILPMGDVIDCKIGFYIATNSVFLSKLLLFLIFIYRVDLAFHASALGYPRAFLLCLIISYFTVSSALNASHIYASWDLVKYVQSPTDNIVGNQVTKAIGLCTTGANKDKLLSLVIAALFLGDMIFSIIVCSLFVYKLAKVIKLTDDGKKKKKSKQNKQEQKKHSKLTRLMKKQTILVSLAVLTTFTVLGLGAWNFAFSLLIPFDAACNAFCVWLMFTFADTIWNKIMHCCCYCCYCCGDKKEDFLMSMESFSRTLSVRSFSKQQSSSNRNGLTTHLSPQLPRSPSVPSTDLSKSNTEDKVHGLVPINQRHSEKNKDIPINFTNNKRVMSMSRDDKPTVIELVNDKSQDTVEEEEHNGNEHSL